MAGASATELALKSSRTTDCRRWTSLTSTAAANDRVQKARGQLSEDVLP